MYTKGTHWRDSLIQAVEMRPDKPIRDITIMKCDERLIAITSRDLVAAEAYSHASCYKSYTCCHKVMAVNDKSKNDYVAIENKAMQQLLHYIRINIFKDPRLIQLYDHTKKL